MDSLWISLIKSAVARIVDLRRYWKVVSKFVARVSLLEETREARQLENMANFLEAVSKNLALMKKNGVPEETIRTLAIELNVPLIQANLEAMIIARRYLPGQAEADLKSVASSEEKPEGNPPK